MELTWPQKPRLIGTSIPRVDGLLKATGRAKYPSDVHPKGMLFGAVLYSPHAHAKIKSIDVKKAEKIPGVKAVHLIKQAGATVRFQGDDLAAVAAETEEQARDAVRAIQVEYEVQPHVVTEDQALASDAPEVFRGKNVRKGRSIVSGKPEEAMAQADVTIEATYSAPVITHVCLESHGLTARWDADDKLTVWSSTQAVQATAQALAEALDVPVKNVTVLTDYMGGGFGSKFGPDVWGIAAAELARKTKRPVRIFLDRAHEHLAAGNRPSVTGKLKFGASKDGKIVSIIAETRGTGGVTGSGSPPFPYVYEVPASSRIHTDVLVNAGAQRAMRAPGHPQACILMESAMDDLAEALDMDPLELRLKNLGEADPLTPIYQAEIEIGAKLIGWRENRRRRGKSSAGPIKTGYGMGLHKWGGGGTRDKQATCSISRDGSVEVRAGTQDLGTATRTILAIVAAEVLGLQPTDVFSNIGNSTFPPGQASGGSTTAASMAPPAFDAAVKARDAFLKRIAPTLHVEPGDLTLKDGSLWVRGEPNMSWKEACLRLGTATIEETGKWQEGLSSVGVGGCQFAEVSVDVETGVVRVKKIVAVQDSGLILDRLTWDSQVYGGVIMGLNYGLFEERVMDPTTGVMLNPDMELYKLAGASDIPEIVIHAYEPQDQKDRGVIGIGEPPTISTAAAIGNAVSNAIGVRVPVWPMTPQNVLDALAAAQGGKA